ncbi:MAG: hypothetical protein E7516_07080 [Ruminococcaceae bacterium]|nr:hypothetical protein [Oscillospiraceae bacterium]
MCGTTESKSGTFAKVYDSSWKRPYSFVAKFSKTGTMSWVKGFGSSSAPVTLSDVTVLSNGTIIAVGYTKATDYAANKDSSGSVDAIILKLNSSNGYMSMKKSFGGKNTDMFTCVEATGTTFVAGGKSYSTTHDFAHLEGESAILMSFNANLAKQWQTQLHGSAASNISDIAVDSNGSIFATCLTAATDGDFAGYKNSGGYTDTLVLKYDGSGNKIWSRMISSTGRDEFGNIAPDGKGGCVVAGYYELLANQTPDGSLKGIHHCGGIDALVFRLNDDGTQRWVKTLSGLEDDFITDIVKVKNGFAVTGYTASSNREFAQTGNEGLYDGFVSFVNTNGVTVNTLTQAGTQDDMAECLVYTALGEVYGMGKTKSVDTDFKDINPYTEQTYMGYIAKFTVE